MTKDQQIRLLCETVDNQNAEITALRAKHVTSEAANCRLREALLRFFPDPRQLREETEDHDREVCSCEWCEDWREIRDITASGPCAHAAEVQALSEQLEADRTAVADGITKANRAIDSRHWLTEGRGSYEWNDDRWHDEFYAAALEIKAALEPLAKISANWKGCPQTTAEVAKARIDLKADNAKLRAVENNRWCIVPPNGETEHWSVFANFDGEFGYEDQIGSGQTLPEAIDYAIKTAAARGAL